MLSTTITKDRISEILYRKSGCVYKDSIENPPHSTFCLELFERGNQETHSIEFLVGLANGVLLISEPLTLDLNECESEDTELQLYMSFYESIFQEANRLICEVNKSSDVSLEINSADGILRIHCISSPSEYHLVKHIDAMQKVLEDLWLYENSGW